MSFFVQATEIRLYLASTGPNDSGWLAYVVSKGKNPGPGLELGPAYGDPQIGGTFVFSTRPVDLPDGAAQTAFVGAVDAILNKIAPGRAVLWLLDPDNISLSTVVVLGLAPDGSSVASRLTAALTDTWSFFITTAVGLDLAAGSTTLALSTSGPDQIGFDGSNQPVASTIGGATLDFAGPARGAFTFQVFLQRTSLVSTLAMGFQFLIPTNDPVRDALSEWAPLASPTDPGPADMIGFTFRLDPSDPTNQVLPDRTVLTFTGTNVDQTPTLLASYYRTSYGHPISLAPAGALAALPGEVPAGLEIALGEPADANVHTFRMSPRGDFVLVVDDPAEDAVLPILCGWSGTETIGASPRTATYAGDRLRFFPQKAAYAPAYPPPPASPVLPPFDPNAPLLTTRYTTSWASVLRAPGAAGAISYAAEPKGAPLLGRDDLIFAAHNTLFGPAGPVMELPADRVFPMVPYAGMAPGGGGGGFPAELVERFEREVIGPTRRALLGAPQKGGRSHRTLLHGPASPADAAPSNTTTPAGLLVTLTGAGAWKKILLAQVTRPSLRQVCFCNPDAALQQAFQTNQLFLAVASPAHLGQLAGAGDGTCGDTPTFQNRIGIGGWEIQADVGQNRYGDYSNVILVKGRRGPLFDPTSDATRKGSLVSSPTTWTQAADFGVTGEEVALSAWLQAYFQDAADRAGDPYFDRFNAIARSAEWTGILILRATIARVPDDLAGIVAGVTDPSRFNVHHLGIEISHVQNDPAAPAIELSHDSSMFGLINYRDPDFTPPPAGQPPSPVAPAAGADYDFRLLTLQVLFENTAVKELESLAQLTLNSLFGMQPARMGDGGNSLNTIVLQGSYQQAGGASTYSLRTDTPSTFYFDSNVFRKIEIDSVVMTTLNPGDQPVNPTVISLFGLSGFLDFLAIADRSGQPFDVLSFGSDGDDALRRGLSFAGLGVVMSAPKGDNASRSMVFDPSGTRLDPKTSTPRSGSLVSQLVLQVRGLVASDKDSPPSKHGFLDVLTDAMLTGVNGTPWYGLVFDLAMGSPGALAGGAGLTSSLLVAWSPDSAGPDAYTAMMGIALPGTGGGAKLISLQNVLRLSIGQIRLTRDAGKQAFLLMLTDIALKFLGLLKIPPNGATMFYLFGDPEGAGAPSGLGWYAMYKQPDTRALPST